MRDYRVYVIGDDGHIQRRFEFHCSDDEEAKEHAKQYVDGHEVELWHEINGSQNSKPRGDAARLLTPPLHGTEQTDFRLMPNN